MNIRVHPDWRRIVGETDHNYVSEILSDFKQRAKSDPADLFKQASSLVLGPLITHTVSSTLTNYQRLFNLCRGFVEL